MKKMLSVVTLVLFLSALSFPLLANDSPKDSLKTEKGCPKKGDKKCEAKSTKSCDQKDCKKKCDKSGKSCCSKETKKTVDKTK